MSGTPRPSRQRSLFELHWPWLLMTLLFTFVTCAVALAIDLGLLAGISSHLGPMLRGYTLTGALLGIWTVLLFFATLFYSLRKRVLQEHLPIARATMASWLWAHVYLGIFGLVTACVHGGYGSFSLQLSTGKLLLVSLAVLVLSGVIWRLVYGLVPPLAARNVGNYSQAQSLELAERLSVEIEKIAAGHSSEFHALKQRLLTAGVEPESQSLGQALAVHEQQPFGELLRAVAARQNALARRQRQARYTRFLQGWRLLHVPLVLAVFALLPLHLVMAYDLPARLVPPGTIPGTALGGFETADSCERCHAKIVEQWRGSMHAHAMTSPLMIAQTNQVIERSLNAQTAPETRKICVNCHGPVGASLSSAPGLPLKEQSYSDTQLLNEGIACSVCHQWDGTSAPGSAALTSFAEGFRPGRTYFGPIADPVGNAFHRSERSASFENPEQLCQNCHVVQLDKNGDGKFVKGTDLVLQTLFDEWRDYFGKGGSTCVSCHMPVVAETRAAEAALIPFEQDRSAPERVVHDHSFVGVDHSLETPAATQPQHAAREALLKRAAKLELLAGSVVVDKGQLSFVAKITNSGVGHYLPGGFAFVRQMWLEVSVENAAGALLVSSGRLARPTEDLCDASIIDDTENPMRAFVQGCQASDPLLVNLQQQLVDAVEVARDDSGNALLDERNQFKLARAERGREAVLQFLDGGPVARVRPFDRKPMPPLAPGEVRGFAYRFALGPPNGVVNLAGGKLTLRLLFRALPPYFVRALAAGQPRLEKPALAPLIGNLHVYEMNLLTHDL